mmetsp:Transcript_64919/g.154991  ORF Transcript_64919/g.154991 Transcript_64919/m.154991 type:complete len:245 (+) Transcript_64919:986-1720(+)
MFMGELEHQGFVPSIGTVCAGTPDVPVVDNATAARRQVELVLYWNQPWPCMRSGLNAHHQNGEFSTGWSSCAIIVEHLPGDGHLIAFELEVPEERRCVGVPLRVVASAPQLFSCGWRRAGGRTFPSAVDCEDGRVLVVLDDGNDARIAFGLGRGELHLAPIAVNILHGPDLRAGGQHVHVHQRAHGLAEQLALPFLLGRRPCQNLRAAVGEAPLVATANTVAQDLAQPDIQELVEGLLEQVPVM